MKRRTFQGAIAAAIGSLAVWRPAMALAAKATPSTRWEWEVEEWTKPPFIPTSEQWMDGIELVRRKWTAAVVMDGLSDEPIAISHERWACNSTFFCGVSPGHLNLSVIECKSVGKGLVECQVTLHEMNVAWSDIVVHYNPDCVNFHDVLRGSHSVVNIGGKEVLT